MAILKNNGLRACVILLTCIFGFLALVKAMEKEKEITTAPMTVYFQAESNDPSAIQNSSNWDTEPGDIDCGGFTYLCEVTFDTNTYPDLDAFLQANQDRESIEDNALAVSHKD